MMQISKVGILLSLVMLSSCATQLSEVENQQTAGYAPTDDGVRISYELVGPPGAPTLWVGYPWSRGFSQFYAEISGREPASNAANEQLLELLTRNYQVLYVDYPRGFGKTTGPLAGDLPPETVARDYEAVADAAGVDRFVVMGFSWGGALGIQVAPHSERCAGLAVGGWPVLGAPFEEIIPQSTANTAALPLGKPKDIYGSNVNFYKASLAQWDESKVLETLSNRAGMLYLYVGSEDVGVPSIGLPLPLAERVIENKERLESAGWKVDVFEGYDHSNLPMDVWVTGILDLLEGKTW